MLKLLFIVFLGCWLFVRSDAHAHPVTFRDGAVLQYEMEGGNQSAHVHYSITNRHAAALVYDRFEESDREFFSLRFNHLLQRWNEAHSQGNLYLWGGAGVGLENGANSVPVGVAGFQADWETRRYYMEAGAEHYQGSADRDATEVRARVGIAPYLAEFEEPQLFLIAQAKYISPDEEMWRFGPVARLFYKTYLVEVGIDHTGDVSGMFMIHLFLG